MAPCPLCVIGRPKPHSKQDWLDLQKPEIFKQYLETMEERGDQAKGFSN